MKTLVTNPLIPGHLWAALAVVSLGAVAAYLLVKPPRVPRARRVLIGGFLVLSVVGILALLLNPTWEELQQSRLVRPVLGVLIDTSGSMETADCSGLTRLRAATDLALRLRDQLTEEFEVRLWRFDADLHALPADELDRLRAEGVATDVGGSIERALASGLGEDAALVVLSDGIHNVPDTLGELTKSARTARAMAVPIFARTFGTDAVVQDVSLDVVTPDDVAFVGREVPIRVLVRHTAMRQGSVEVTLHAGDEMIASQTVRFLDESPARAEFPVKQDRPGLYRYLIRAAPLPQEMVRSNNERVFYLRVIDTPIHVLVLEGKPYWDFKFLLRSLAEDPGICVTGAVRVKDGRVLVRRSNLRDKEGDAAPGREDEAEILAGGESFLSSFEALKDYQIIMLGRDAEAFLSGQNIENLCRWIGQWGGALVCARGRPLPIVPERLDAVMPVRWKAGPETRFRLQLSSEAEFMGWFPKAAALMPSLATGTEVDAVKALATVVARAESRGEPDGTAAVTYQPYGAGDVVVIEGSGLWRWAFLATDGAADRDIFSRFWNSLLRWLAASADFLPGETAALHTTQRTYTSLERVVIQLMVRDDPRIPSDSAPLIAVLSGEDGREVCRLAAMPQGNAPGVFRAATDPLPTGSYVAELVRSGESPGARCAFEVQAPVQERLDLRARPGLMKRLAEESGGQALADDPAAEVRAAYMSRWQARHPDEFRRTPAWDRVSFLLALVAAMGAVWILRRRGGLV
jgi:hypothetical protein